jgi:hypothetical protein
MKKDVFTRSINLISYRIYDQIIAQIEDQIYSKILEDNL